MKKRSAMDDIIKMIEIPQVEPIPPKVSEPTPEVAAAAAELDQEIGVLHRRRRKHRRVVEEGE
jgi:hypothetical protein